MNNKNRVTSEEELQAEWREWDEEVHGDEKRRYFEEAQSAVENRTANRRRAWRGAPQGDAQNTAARRAKAQG